MILAEAFVTPGFRVLGWIGIITAGLTAYYTFRVWFRVCAGPTHYEMGDEATVTTATTMTTGTATSSIPMPRASASTSCC